MSDKKPDGGYEHDLRDAENAMAAAGHPDIALGMRRHSEAQRNMMQGVLVPMFVQMVERSLDTKLAPLIEVQKETHSGIAALSTQFQTLAEDVSQLKDDMHESQEDRQSIRVEVAGVKDDVADVRSDVAALKAQIAELRGDYSPAERQRLTTVLLQMIADYETAHGDATG